MTNIDIDNLEADMAKVTIREERFYCPLCGAGYKREGHLNNHMIKKHQHDHELKKMVLQCPECEYFLSSKQALERHILNVHRACKYCNISFSNESDLKSHLKTHTYCSKCNVDCKTITFLKRHRCHM